MSSFNQSYQISNSKNKICNFGEYPTISASKFTKNTKLAIFALGQVHCPMATTVQNLHFSEILPL